MQELMNAYWKFAAIYTIEEPTFNRLLESFYEYGLNSLVRENIQNALDAKLQDTEEPVKVTINIGEMKTKHIPGIDGIREHINCLRGGNNYTRETIVHMQEKVQQETVYYMTFEDSNTRGLSEETWEYYAYKKGAHYFEENDDVEDMRGGSHGVGKIASNAASDIHMMFFANHAEDGSERIGGTIQLVEHEYSSRKFRSTGYFTDGAEETGYIPYDNTYQGIFEKKTRGLKIIIPFLREHYRDEKEVVRAVCDNFFLAILNHKLIVETNNYSIDCDSILNIVHDVDIYEEQDADVMTHNFTPLYIDSLLEMNSVNIQVKDKSQDYFFDLYIKYDEQIKRGRIAIFRTIGMKIEDFKVQGHAKSPFNAVLIPRSEKEDRYIKSLENESHTKMDTKHIKNKEQRSNAVRFINNLGKALAKEISDKMNKENPTDGPIDTKDLFYSLEHNFKKKLMSQTSAVSITPAGKEKKTLVVKKDRNKKPEKEKMQPAISVGGTASRTRKKKGEDTEKGVYTYPVKYNRIQRLVVGDREQLQINISDDPNYNNESKCNMHLKIIDGQGKLSEDLVVLNQCYQEIYDVGAQKTRKTVENRINGIDIIDGKIELNMKTHQTLNDALKFMYYLEVDV